MKTAALLFISLAVFSQAQPIGTHGTVGCLANPTAVSRLEITKSGVYENYFINAGGKGGNTVKITADNVTVRNCEIFNGANNAIGVFGNNVVIENCRIHHMLASTFKDQHDAHGISGHWGNITVRNCDISYCSGDCIQFDPDRASQGSIVVEDCHLWTGPLPADAAGFKAGERPGENAFDTKTKPTGPRCQLIVRNTYLHGFNQPAQIGNVASLNLKEHVDAEITNCVFADNEIAFRVRGPGERGGAHVTISDCAVYDTLVGVRAEDKIEVLKISGLLFGKGVGEPIRFTNGKATAGYENKRQGEAPPIELLLKNGFPKG